jgi:hypothetical protein
MAQADNSLLTPHSRNLATVLRHALRLAKLAGEEQNAVRRDALIAECMACWRAAQRLRRYPDMASRA